MANSGADITVTNIAEKLSTKNRGNYIAIEAVGKRKDL